MEVIGKCLMVDNERMIVSTAHDEESEIYLVPAGLKESDIMEMKDLYIGKTISFKYDQKNIEIEILKDDVKRTNVREKWLEEKKK